MAKNLSMAKQDKAGVKSRLKWGSRKPGPLLAYRVAFCKLETGVPFYVGGTWSHQCRAQPLGSEQLIQLHTASWEHTALTSGMPSTN